MTREIPEEVMEAVKAVVEWSRGDDDPLGILESDIPVLDNWLVELGVLPPLVPFIRFAGEE
jgi:hypothetical protein